MDTIEQPTEEKRPDGQESDAEKLESKISSAGLLGRSDTRHMARPYTEPKDRLLDWKQVKMRPSEELFEAILDLVVELKGRSAKETRKVATDDSPPFIEVDTDVKRLFVRLPAKSKIESSARAATSWSIILLSSRPHHKPLALEVYDEVSIGRIVEEVMIDLDLTDHDAEALGVSRRHAILRPTEDKLLLADLGSSNGTFLNQEKMSVFDFKKLQDKDTISFAQLHYKIRILSQPGQME